MSTDAHDARRYHALPSPFAMKRGGQLQGARVAYETWGRLNEARDNAVLDLSGLSPSAHAASCDEDPPPDDAATQAAFGGQQNGGGDL